VSKRSDDQYSEQETQRRFEKLLRSALTTPPKPLKSMTRKRRKAQRGKRNVKSRG
jgi:hypothetical protein